MRADKDKLQQKNPSSDKSHRLAGESRKTDSQTGETGRERERQTGGKRMKEVNESRLTDGV